MDNPFSAQLRYTIETLMSPQGMIGAIGWVLLLAAITFSPKTKWFVLIAMMWCSALGFTAKEGAAIQLATPLDQIRSQCRLLDTALLVALALPALLGPRGWRLRVISLPIVLYFVFEMLLGTRILIAGVEDRGVTTLFIYPIIFFVLGWGVSKWVQDWEDAHKVLRCIAIAGAVYVLGCCYQLLINPSAILVGRRLMGTSGNAQMAALLISMSLPATCYLVARKSEPMISRLPMAAIAGLMIVMLLWTGSRTGMIIAGLGIVLSFRGQLGRFLLVGLIVGIFALLAVQIYAESTTTFTEMFARGNTRSQVWSEMYGHFLENPMFGSMRGGYATGENSYLAAASTMGLFGVVPLFAFVVASVWMVYRLFRVRSLLGSEKPFADLLIGSMVSLFVGALFEAYLLGTLTFPVFVIYLYIALIVFVLDAVRVSQQNAALGGIDPAGAFILNGQQQDVRPYGEFAEQYV